MKLKNFLSVFVVLTTIAGSCFMSCSQSKQPATLKDALKGKFYIGAALTTRQYTERDTANITLVKQHFNAIVAENDMKPVYLQPREGEFFFDNADRFVEFGERNGMIITGHCLIWHSQLPQWFCVDENGNNVAPEILKARMKSHISTVVGRYKGRIKGWDVVNEAILEDGSYRNSRFYQILGEEFIPLAFQYAQEADPDCELYYNDYNEWYPGRIETIVRLIRTLKSRGIRIDAIGMQGHAGMDSPTIEQYENAIKAYINEGVKVMITEFDLSILPVARQGIGAELTDTEAYRREIDPYTEGVPDDVMLVWTNRMLDFFKLFIKYQDHVDRVTMWGVSDGTSWKNGFPVRGRTDYPLLFDRSYQPKPVVDEIIKLAGKKK